MRVGDRVNVVGVVSSARTRRLGARGLRYWYVIDGDCGGRFRWVTWAREQWEPGARVTFRATVRGIATARPPRAEPYTQIDLDNLDTPGRQRERSRRARKAFAEARKRKADSTNNRSPRVVRRMARNAVRMGDPAPSPCLPAARTL